MYMILIHSPGFAMDIGRSFYSLYYAVASSRVSDIMDLKSLFFVAALSFPCILLASPVPGTIEWPPLHVVSRSFNEHSILSPSFNKKRGDGTANDDVANGTKQKALAAEALENALASLPRDGPCTKDNIEIRPEW